MIYASIASTPNRLNALIQTIHSLSHQVDKIFVYLNGYESIPNITIKNVIFYLSEKNNGAIGKFLIHNEYNLGGNYYWFTCDDDIVYPKDYVDFNIKIHKYGTLQSSHGKIYSSFPIKNYANPDKRYHFVSNVINNNTITIGGTGVMMLPSHIMNSIPIIYEDSIKNSVDIWISSWAYNNNIEILQVPHEENWLISQNIDYSNSIYNNDLKNKHKNATNLANKLFKIKNKQ